MGELHLEPVPFKSLPAPFLRVLPTVFEYARLTAARGVEVGPEAHQQFIAHVRALRRFVTAVARAGEWSSDTIAPLERLCDVMASLRGTELARSFADFIADLQALYQCDHERVRAAMAERPDRYRDLYTAEIRPLRILAVYTDETWAKSETMQTALTERCWYNHRRHRDSAGPARLEGIDVALFAPGQRPIGANIEEAMIGAQVPVLVLAALHKHEAAEGMAQARTEFWYRRSKFRVLHAPFPPFRLYQAIDVLHLQHLAWLHAAGREVEAAAC